MIELSFLRNYSTWEALPFILSALTALAILSWTITAIRNVYFHPLSGFPGPKFAAATHLYTSLWSVLGQRHRLDEWAHAKYGEVVRLSPERLSFIGNDAWRDIYMHKQGQSQFPKLNRLSNHNPPPAYSIINAPDDIHSRQRKALSHAFSERALREQEPLIKSYVDLMMANMREDAEAGRPSDMVSYLNWITFDIIGDLSFAQSFDALKTRTTHPWIAGFFASLKVGAILSDLASIPVFRPLLLALIIPMRMSGRNKLLRGYCGEKIEERIKMGKLDRPDFLSKVLAQNEKNDENSNLSMAEINATFNILMIAGSETTATVLAGCVFLLQKNPEALAKLKDEVRSAFANEDEITVTNVNKLPYLLAVLEESLRHYPPVPVSLPRVTPPSGATVCGYYIPRGTVVGIPQYAAGHSPKNFSEAESFIPERFMQNHDPKFDSDKKAVLQPFSAGPRNCIGRNLAYAEMKLILARIVYNFDLTLVDQNENWIDQDVHILWRKRPLAVTVTERN